MKKHKGPKVLVIDIETAPLEAWVWGLFDQNIGLSQISKETFILSFSAKWLGSPESEIIYHDQRHKKNKENDKPLLKKIWKLLDECDVAVGQNSNRFDVKKINAGFALHDMKPPSSYKRKDTLVMAKKNFSFTSNKLEWLTDKLCTKYKKLKHKKFAGFTLWKECLAGNLEAFEEMEKYNNHDVLSTEELYTKLAPWDIGINVNLYTDTDDIICQCGSEDFKRNGFSYTSSGKYQRHKCLDCGAETRDRKNLFTKNKMKSLRVGTNR